MHLHRRRASHLSEQTLLIFEEIDYTRCPMNLVSYFMQYGQICQRNCENSMITHTMTHTYYETSDKRSLWENSPLNGPISSRCQEWKRKHPLWNGPHSEMNLMQVIYCTHEKTKSCHEKVNLACLLYPYLLLSLLSSVMSVKPLCN